MPPHLGLDLHGRPVGLDESPPSGHVHGVPGVSPPVVHKLLGWLVLLRLAEALDDDGMEAGIGAHPLVEQRLGLNAKLDAPEEVGGGAPGVPLLGVVQEPVTVLKLLLCYEPESRYVNEN